jgi:hypothetical protein
MKYGLKLVLSLNLKGLEFDIYHNQSYKILKFIKCVEKAKTVYEINKTNPEGCLRLKNLLKDSILENRCEFIQSLLYNEENDDLTTIQLKNFLNKKMLLDLYNHQIVRFFNFN